MRAFAGWTHKFTVAALDRVVNERGVLVYHGARVIAPHLRPLIVIRVGFG
jgi:hypothetical protein